MTQRQLNPTWLAALGRELDHWLAQTTGLPHAAAVVLDSDREAILRAIRLGLEVPGRENAAAQLTLQLSPLIEQRGYWGEWLPILQRSIGKLVPCALRVRLIDQLGFFLRLSRQFGAAEAAHRQAAEEARALRLADELPRIWFNLATTEHEHNRFGQSRQTAQEALALYEQLPRAERDPLLQASLANLLGLIAVETGRPAEALPQLETAVAVWTAHGHTLYRARALNNRARALERLGRFEEAVQTRATALDLIKTEYPLDAVLFALNQAAAYAGQGDLAAAVTAWSAVDLTYLRRIGHVQYEAMILTNLGDSHLRLGRPETAEPYLRDAVRLWRTADDRLYLANAVGTLGEVLAARGLHTDARRHWQEALTLLAAFPDSAWAQELTAIFRPLLEAG